ncbi:hypothetical protein TRP8649_00855 [Pelagimonas phthalicica]|uniref:Uncharacterized protein n=1 Tax=Pelagimonas phthalicica TaxID=1037362 RepID=A0A238J7T1_9RHOB|nr:hypothetical protein [Pelagimonas phthalicica]TDS94702.1 hypothetical protein CLV87_1216 [Pelagimonas phthalicica]SMX26770.1 hypothetical protein TRP8649_00855 [Pelagimonas phthalicica]
MPSLNDETLDWSRFRVPPPNPLFRRFNSKEQSEEFLSGQIRLKNLIYYREIEDVSRRDELEGISFVEGKGLPMTIKDSEGKLAFTGNLTSNLKLSTAHPERYFISCFSSELCESHRKWGEWVVQINNPMELFQDLSAETPNGFELIWGPVEYSDQPRGPEAFDARDTWRRKRFCFSSEKEFRLALYGGALETPKKEAVLTMEYNPKDSELILLRDP